MLLDLVVSVISGVSQKVSADRKRKKEIKELDKTKKKLGDQYYTLASQDYLDSGEGLHGVKSLGEKKKTQDEEFAHNVSTSGAVAEAEVAKASALNQSYANAVNDLATVGTKKKADLKKQYQSEVNKIENKKADLRGTRKNLMSYINL
ncbi:MAG: hypothetical protein RR550_04815 [Rikenellaceae bacterium]